MSETALPWATASLFRLRIISVRRAGEKSEQVMHTFPNPARFFSFMLMEYHSNPCPMGKGSLSRIQYLLFSESVTALPMAGSRHTRRKMSSSHASFFLLVVK